MNALIAAWSLKSFRHGFSVGAGAMTADFVLMLLTLALYTALSQLPPIAFKPFFITGGLFFLYLAYKIHRSAPPNGDGRPTDTPLRGYVLGLGLGLVNPYQVGWWITAGLSSIAQFGLEWAVGLFTAILTWISAFPAAVRAGWRLSNKWTWLAIRTFSVFVLIAFGIYFLYKAVW